MIEALLFFIFYGYKNGKRTGDSAGVVASSAGIGNNTTGHLSTLINLGEFPYEISREYSTVDWELIYVPHIYIYNTNNYSLKL